MLLYEFGADRSNPHQGEDRCFAATWRNAAQEPMDDTAEILRQLVELRIEHRDLDAVITRLAADPAGDELQLKRMKKRKLRLKYMIAYLENKLIPDLDA
jgi:hypothetical protein